MLGAMLVFLGVYLLMVRILILTREFEARCEN